VPASVSVIIPAHNEANTLGRNLATLHAGAPEMQVVVVCNGCTDATAAVARAAEPPVRTIEIEEPSKAAAVRAGNEVVTTFPRLHLDADVEISGSSVAALTRPLGGGRILATAPLRILPKDRCSPLVRWYYDVWEQLPQVRTGLFGRGAFALSEAGQARVSALPHVLSDDLAVSEAFTEAERLVVDEAVVVVHPPRTVADLLRRRIRVDTGNRQADGLSLRTSSARTRPADLWSMARRQPRLLPRIPVFLAVTVVSRVMARRVAHTGDFTTWRRDESSRQP